MAFEKVEQILREDMRTEIPVDEILDRLGMKTHRHTFRLREDFVMRLELPLDVTRQEVERLSDFVRTLSFEGLA